MYKIKTCGGNINQLSIDKEEVIYFVKLDVLLSF